MIGYQVAQSLKNAPKKKILVVDDEELLTRMLKLSLERTGRYEVLTENSPVKALAQVGHFSPDLILLDIIMPEMAGPALAEKLRNDPKSRHVPIIFLSGCHAGVAKGYLQLPKPISVEEIISSIEKELGRASVAAR